METKTASYQSAGVQMINPGSLAVAVAAAFTAGIVNSISGGGTLITFPILLALGIPSVRANATSTVALWPGVIGSMWGYRKDLRGAGGWALMIFFPSALGGLIGAMLLLHTRPQQFDRIAPFLVLGATLLFMGHGIISRLLKTSTTEDSADSDREPRLGPGRALAYGLFQLLVALYGGYFGAGIGILMLAALGIMGLKDIHRMNGLKAWGAFCINGVAVVTFVAYGMIDWPVGLTMAVGGIAGGYTGARLARRVGQTFVRKAIIALGLLATASLLSRAFAGKSPI